MSRTITAMFDSRADAESAKNRLRDAGISDSSVTIHDKSSPGYSDNQYSTREDRGIWQSIKDVFVPDEDRHTYEEGIRRGHVLLTAQVDEDRADDAVRALDQADSVDVDERAAGWRDSGWTGPTTGAGYGATTGAAGLTGTADYADRDRVGATTDSEQRIPIVEEQLRVGKREVNRGGVRVRSYVVETPVSEQVNLREEHVSVERRPVTGATAADTTDAFRERSFEVTETAEEAVVAKDAVVREEVVVRKDAGSRTETVSDTVRRTEVDIDRDAHTATRDANTGQGSVLDRDGDGRTELTDGVGVNDPLQRR